MEIRFAAWMSKRDVPTADEHSRFSAAAAREGLTTRCIGAKTMLATSTAWESDRLVVVGDVFRRGQGTRLGAEDWQRLSRQRHAAWSLVEDHWGSYVALGALEGETTQAALRAPFGDLACYWFETDGGVAVASSIKLVLALGEATAVVDWSRVACFLGATDLRDGGTCLRDVQELGGGQVLLVSSGRVMVEHRWLPWRWAGRASQVGTRDAAADILRAALDTTISARVPADQPSIVLLSGGLDSSIVAAGLAKAGRPFTALTMAVGDRQGDERAQARTVADHLGRSMTEQVRDVAAVDLGMPLLSNLPRPTGAAFRQATFAAVDALARRRGASLAIDGGGGDNMFCSVQSASPVADALLARAPLREVAATAASIARMAQVSTLDVLRAALVKTTRRRHRYRWPIDRALLAPGVEQAFLVRHPWLLPPAGMPPGKIAQVGLLLAATAVVESPDPERRPRFLSPLVAQPIAEAALRVPTWMWFEDGRNRAAIRRAYATRLPPCVIARRSKGTPTGFLAALVEQNSGMLRTMLLDGLLATHGVIDRVAVEAALHAGPARDLGFARLLQLADAEAWARSWHR